MPDSIEEFKEQHPSTDSYWRSIILFGKNVASYKFALGKTLFDLSINDKSEFTLGELAEPFSRHICEHLKEAPKQATSRSSSFLETCKQYNEGEISKEKLIDVTVEKGFNNVIDAFHVVNNKEIPIEFYSKDYERGNKKIVLTDDFYKLKEMQHSDDLITETESRWNLVETAWELGISRNLLNVRYDNKSELFFVDNTLRRKDVTSARGALNGYQKGKCFYCFGNISTNSNSSDTCDVDHYFPHTLQPYFPDINLDGVWNLVLACPPCNRGADGKFARVPLIKYLERLHKRNEFLISSHHPLRETIIEQTGKTEEERRKFLLMVDKRAIDIAIHRWGTEQVAEATF